MRRGFILFATFAIAFAAGRYLPPAARGWEEPAPAVAEDVETTQPSASTSSAPRSGSGPRPAALAPRPNPRQTPWIAHVALDPEHHAADTQRIQDAVFGAADAITELDACRPLFAPIESRLELRTTITISRTGIDIGPVERVEVVDGLELSDEARACVLSAFRRTARAQPAHPQHVHPYQGPFDLVLSVIGGPDEVTPAGDDS